MEIGEESRRDGKETRCDLLVIGGGINGVGIARDAAGRGLSVTLVERADLASATLTWPTRFVMPHVPELRPRWMIRVGLFLYDHLARRSLLPPSQAVRLDAPPYASGLKRELKHGFVYSDCRVDDARLVVANAVDAYARGARILTRTECVSARRDGNTWRATLSNGEDIEARAIVNAAGPWVKKVLNEHLRQPSSDAVRLVRGSHILLRRLYEGDHAFILQNDDRRVVFMIPYGDEHTLVGTTDVPQNDIAEPPAAPALATDAEVEYLCRAVNRYLARPARVEDVVWRYAGVRPLYDDGSSDPSAVTRDYTLRVDEDAGTAPVLSVFGGKITTAKAPFPGSDFGAATRVEARDAFFARHADLSAARLRPIFRRHGMQADAVVGDGNLGEDYGAGLTEREVRYFVDHEWAWSAEDVLWRRTKCGLLMNEAQRARVRQLMGQ